MIGQGSLTEITREYINHMHGEKLDFKALMSERERDGGTYEIQNGTAIIPLKGVMTPGLSFFSFFFDGTSTKNVQKNIQAALDNADVNRIILDTNSGGGSVEGAFELADFIQYASTQKEVIAFSDGTIASAAYLAVSGASKIYITGKSNIVGSVGVIARKLDYSKMNEMSGLEVDEFVTGKYKNTSSSDKKTTDEDRKEIQAMVDKNFAPMVADISERRGIEPQKLVEMNGAVFVGAESIENGLVDGVSTLDELINMAPGAANFNIISKKVNMTKDELKAAHPELFAQMEADAFKLGAESGSKDGQSLGAETERIRIDGINQACFPGQETLAAAMIADGKTQPEEAAMRFNVAEKQTREDAGTAAAAAMPKPVEAAEPVAKPAAVKPVEETKTPEETFEASAELKAEFDDVESYKAFLTAEAGGQVNVFQRGDK